MKYFFILLILLVGCTQVNYSEIEKCLLEKEVKMYGVEWCPVCAKQKQIFDSKLEGIYVECIDNPQLCLDKNVEGYPTWEFGEERHLGLLQPEELAAKAGCTCSCTKEVCSC